MSYLSRLASFLWDSEVPQSQAPSTSDARQTHPEATSEEPPPATSGCLFDGRRASVNYWKHRVSIVDAGFLEHQKLHDVMGKLHMSAGDVFDFRLPDCKLSSKVLEHCSRIIDGLCAKHYIFKVGVTVDPHARWHNPAHGYYKTSFRGMKVLAILHYMEAAALLEAALIRMYKGSQCCLNEAPGGEGISVHSSPAFVYVVWK